MISHIRPPTAPLDKYVESILYFKGYMPDHTTERVVPDGMMHLIMELDGEKRIIYDNEDHHVKQSLSGAWFAGLQIDYLTISTHVDSEMIVARFHPYGAYSFIQEPMTITAGRILAQHEFSKKDPHTLRAKIIAAKDPEVKIRAFENDLINSIDSSLSTPELIKNAIEFMRNNAFIRLKELVEESSYSKKQFIHLFKKYTGITPKLYQRIIRFNELLHKIQNKEMISWTQVSLDCGYYDQAHFIKDFKAFSGLNPGEFLEIHQESERINFFPFE